ncbi:MAG: PIG-L family deacetylase [Microgenomates group bacterium]
MNIQIVVAHPDDEIIMCGATIDKLIHAHHHVHVTFCTLNDQAYFGSETQSHRMRRAKNEAIRSSRKLGYTVSFLGYKDMEVEHNKGLLMQHIIREIRKRKPDVIITHHGSDKHIDHRTIGEIIPEANFQSGCNLCGGNKTWSAHAVLQGEIDLEMTSIFIFDTVSAVTEKNINQKMQAFQCYASVDAEHKTETTWLVKKCTFVASLRGRSIGKKYGEAFIINNYSPLDHEAVRMIGEVIKER